MRLSRADGIPLLTIIAGGVIGASFTVGSLASRSPSYDVSVRFPEVSVDAPLVRVDAPLVHVVAAPSAWASAFDLQQNYPNPFNPETTIPFVLHEGLFAEGRPAQVSIRIFNGLTQLVASPVALGHPSGEGAVLMQLEYARPGAYEAFWDGTDQSGRPVASGIYFLQMAVDGLPRKVTRLYKAR